MTVVRSRCWYTTAATIVVAAFAVVNVNVVVQVVDAEETMMMMPMESSAATTTATATNEADDGEYYDPLGEDSQLDLDQEPDPIDEEIELLSLAREEAEHESQEADEAEALAEEEKMLEEEYVEMVSEAQKEMWQMDAEEEHLNSIIRDASADYIPENPKPEDGILVTGGSADDADSAAPAAVANDGGGELVDETMSDEDVEATMRHVRQMQEEREERRLRRRQRKTVVQTPPAAPEEEEEEEDDDDTANNNLDSEEPLEYLPDHGEADPELDGFVDDGVGVFEIEGQYDAAAYEAEGGDVVDTSANVDVKAPKTTVHGVIEE